MVRVCFVCLGNICRSPTAEGIMKSMIQKEKLQHRIQVDSAGTSSFHKGEPADPRSQKAAHARGYELTSRARGFSKRDIKNFHYIIAMDTANKQRLLSLCSNGPQQEKIFLLRDFDSESPPDSSVPDPYYGGKDGFETVLDICERGCSGLLESIKAQYPNG
tara:strand:- start:579 stop:1061 length:483 start_codon:yes stop_codon:yes gene_type:complete